MPSLAFRAYRVLGVGGGVTRSDLTQHPRLLAQEGETEEKIEKEEVHLSVWRLMSGPASNFCLDVEPDLLGGRLLRQRENKNIKMGNK